MKTFLKFLLAALLVFIIILGFMSYSRFQLPTTAEMKEYFFVHQSRFEQENSAIVSALTQKTVIDSGANTQVGYQWLETQPTLDAYQAGDPIIVRYYTHLRGIGVGTFGAGIAYIDPARTEKIYPSLEAMSDDAKKIEGFIGYSHISGNWYSFFWEAD